MKAQRMKIPQRPFYLISESDKARLAQSMEWHIIGFYDTRQIAEMTGWNIRVVRECCKAKIIPAIKVKGKYRVRKDEYKWWMYFWKIKAREA